MSTRLSRPVDATFSFKDIPAVLKAHSKVVDEVNVAIFNAVYKHGPRNLAEISRVTGLPKSTVHTRVKKVRKIYEPFEAVINAHKIGLGRCLILVKPKAPITELMSKLETPWTYLIEQCLTPSPMLCVWSFYPYPSHDIIVDHVKALVEDGLIEGYEVKLVNEPLVSNRFNVEYVNAKENVISIPWATWLEKASSFSVKPLKPRIELQDEDYVRPPDALDLLILDYMLKDPSIEFLELSRLTGINHQTLRYHFIKHILGRGVIAGYAVNVPLFPEGLYVDVSVIARFSRDSDARILLGALWCSPVLNEIHKARGALTYIVKLSVPMDQLRNLNDFLAGAMELGLIKDVENVMMVSKRTVWKRLPLKLYDESTGRWRVTSSL